MITVRLTGGLGNQMFQYALGRTLAERHHTSLALDVTSYQSDKLREFSLGMFNVDQRFGEFPRRRLVRALGRRLGIPGFTLDLGPVRIPRITYVLRQRNFGFDPAVLEAPDNVYVDGYWQSEKYFKEIELIIRLQFALNGTSDNVLALARHIQSVEAVCVNVRREDYVTDPTVSEFMGFVGLDYYAESMKTIYSKVKNPTVFVFSDDIPWCIQHLQFNCPTTFVGHEYAGEKFWEYLYLMSVCTHFGYSQQHICMVGRMAQQYERDYCCPETLV